MPTDVSAEIDELRAGTLTLRVPLRDDAIQVGTADTLPRATIEVRTGPCTVSVRRTDGTPLQAQIVHRHADGAETLRTVFTEPVARLRLQRLRRLNGSPVWMVVGGVTAHSAADLAQLVQTVVCFASAKQRRDESGPAARPA